LKWAILDRETNAGGKGRRKTGAMPIKDGTTAGCTYDHSSTQLPLLNMLATLIDMM